MIVNNNAEVAGRDCGKRSSCLVETDWWPHSPRGEREKINNSLCVTVVVKRERVLQLSPIIMRRFDHCFTMFTGTWFPTLRPRCWCWHTPTVDCSDDLHTFDCIPPTKKSSGIPQKTWDQTYQNRMPRSTRQYCWAHGRCSLGPRAASLPPRGQIAGETLRRRIFPPRRKSSQTQRWRMLEWSESWTKIVSLSQAALACMWDRSEPNKTERRCQTAELRQCRARKSLSLPVNQRERKKSS